MRSENIDTVLYHLDTLNKATTIFKKCIIKQRTETDKRHYLLNKESTEKIIMKI